MQSDKQLQHRRDSLRVRPFPICAIGVILNCFIFLQTGMAMAAETQSPGGSRIHRYEAGKPGINPPADSGLYYEKIEARYEEMLGPQGDVLHEILSDEVHIDVLTFPPTDARKNWSFATIGMSDKPMSVPEGLEDPRLYQRAELLISLPSDWFGAAGPDFNNAFEDETVHWPIRWLKFIARFPHEYDTWIWYGHSMPNGDPAEPLAENVAVTGFVTGPVSFWPGGKNIIELDDGGLVAIIGLYPVYQDEMDMKLAKGADALFDAFRKYEVTPQFDPERKSVASRRGFFDFLKR